MQGLAVKFSKQAYDAVSEAVTRLDTAERREAYRAGDFRASQVVMNLDERYRWDLFWDAEAYRLIADAGYTDAHIDTALRRIVPPL